MGTKSDICVLSRTSIYTFTVKVKSLGLDLANQSLCRTYEAHYNTSYIQNCLPRKINSGFSEIERQRERARERGREVVVCDRLASQQ